MSGARRHEPESAPASGAFVTPGPREPSDDDAMPRRAWMFVAAVVATSAAAGVFVLSHGVGADGRTVAVWTAAALISQFLIFPSPSDRGEISLGTCVHLGMVLLLPPAVFLPALWISRAMAAVTFQRKPWQRSVFNAAQVSGAVLAAWAVYHAVARALEPASARVLAAAVPAFLAASATYYALNIGSVSTVIAASSGRTPWVVWRDSFGYPFEMLATVALTLLAPVLALTVQQLGTPGLALFFLPMVFVRDASARYAGLRRTQDSLVESERLNARVGIAAEVGHSINGALTVAQAQLQLLVRKRDALAPEELERRVTQALEHLGRIDTLSKGLMDFSRHQADLAPARVDHLVEETVKLLQYQRRFARVRIDLDLDRRIGDVTMDAAQMRQAVLHLLLNAADAMAEAGHPLRPIVVRTRMVGRNVEISVIDAGLGVPERLRERIFEPGYSRRPGGRGFGLSTVRAVARAHHGTVGMWDAPEGGSVFRILIPSRPAASARRPARAARIPRTTVAATRAAEPRRLRRAA